MSSKSYNQNNDQNEITQSGNFIEVINNYEKLLKNTQDELKHYKEKQKRVKDEVLKIIQENQICHEQLQTIQLDKSDLNGIHNKYEKSTSDVIENLKSQIRQLNSERDAVYSLWKTSQVIISNLEKEVNEYRNQLSLSSPTVAQSQKKYSDTIQVLENTIKTLTHELMKQTNINKETFKSKQQIEEKLKEFENSYENLLTEYEKMTTNYKKLERCNSKLQEQLNIAMQTNNDLENSLKITKEAVEKKITREKEALQKVQEAIFVAESAILEKERAINREKLIRSECDQLAETIGQVMEDAAENVEKNVQNLKIQYEEHIRNTENSLDEAKESLEKQSKLIQLAEMRTQALEKKLKYILQENIILDADLQVASQAIIEMELKLEAFELLLDHDKVAYSIDSDKQTELREIILHCKQFKDRWKLAIDEITKKFQQEMVDLQNENIHLKIENEELKLKISQQ